MKEIKYSDCYVAFLDILGFKNKIVDEDCSEIYTVFNLIEYVVSEHAKFKINGVPIPSLDKVQHKIMSDSIVLYIETGIPDALFSLMFTCQYLQKVLLWQENPILLRGGITRGNLFSDNDILFGKSLTDAYLLECNSAIYPRIIITKKILEDGRKNYEMCREISDTIIIYKDSDEFYCVNFMPIGLFELEDGAKYVDNVLNFCQRFLDSCVETRIREKYLWLKQKSIWIAGAYKDFFKLSDKGKLVMEKWGI